MRAFYITAQGKTEVREIAEPAMGPSDVLLRMQYVGYCGSDLNTYRGLNPMVALPRIPGHEISAVIEAAGESFRSVRS